MSHSLFAAASQVEVSRDWTVFGTLPKESAPELPRELLTEIPEAIGSSEGELWRKTVRAGEDGLADLTRLLETDEPGATAYVYIPVSVKSTDLDVRFGFGADWWLTAWLDGKKLVDTWESGNQSGGNSLFPPSTSDFTETVNLDTGEYLLVVRFARGNATGLLAAGLAPEVSEATMNYWHVEEPVYQSLYPQYKNPAIIPGESAYHFGYDIMINGNHVMPPWKPFALQYGRAFEIGERVEEMARHRVHPTLSPNEAKQVAQRRPGFAASAEAGTRPILMGGGRFSAMFGPGRKPYLASLQNALNVNPDLYWAVFAGDEIVRKAETDFLISANKNPEEWKGKWSKRYENALRRNDLDAGWFQAEKAKIRQDYGYGKIDLPRNWSDNDRFEWLAFRRWLVGQMVETHAAIWEMAKSFEKEHGRKLYVMGNDDRGAGGFNLHHPSRFGEYLDIDTHQVQGSSGTRWRQRVAFLTKLMADLTGKAAWPVVHTGTHGGVKTAVEVNEHLSQIPRGGGSGVGFWTRDQRGRRSGKNDSMTDYYGHPGRWKVMMNAVDRLREDGLPSYPKEEYAFFVSNDTAMSFPNGKMDDSDEILFNFLGPVAETWFRFISDIQVVDGKQRLEDWPLIMLGRNDIQRKEVSERFLNYPRDGRTLVALHPRPFAFHADGTATPEYAKRIFGVRIGEPKSARAIRLVEAHPLFPGLEAGSQLPLFGARPAQGVEALPGTEVLAVFDDGSPAITLKRHPGVGRAIYFGVESGLMYIRQAEWRAFMTAFAEGLGLETGLPIWRLQFPMPDIEPPVQRPGDPVCLTGNHFAWWENAMRTGGNARVPDGRYRYTRSPDAPSDGGAAKNGDWIAFTDGDLTDRPTSEETPSLALKRTMMRTNNPDLKEQTLEDYYVGWSSGEGFAVEFDLGEVRRLDRLRFWHGGDRPSLRVVALGADGAEKVVAERPAKPLGHPKDVPVVEVELDDLKANGLRLEFGRRQPGSPDFELAEVDIWRR